MSAGVVWFEICVELGNTVRHVEFAWLPRTTGPQIIEDCASWGCGVRCEYGDQRYRNDCERTLCEDVACRMTTDACPLILMDEERCVSCKDRLALAAAALIRDVRTGEVRVV